MAIMTRTGSKVLEALGDNGFFIPCMHSVGAPPAQAIEWNGLDFPVPESSTS